MGTSHSADFCGVSVKEYRETVTMKVIAVAVAVMALVASATAEVPKCDVLCKQQCYFGLALCSLMPADKGCKDAVAACEKQCDTACTCVTECATKCPAPEVDPADLTKVPEVVSGMTSSTVCRASCDASCGLNMVQATSSEAYNEIKRILTGYYNSVMSMLGLGGAP